jgi:hypothetical protein
MLVNGAAQIEETSMPFPKFVLLHSVTCVQLRPIRILGNCGCHFPLCALALRAHLPQKESEWFSSNLHTKKWSEAFLHLREKNMPHGNMKVVKHLL